VTPKGICLLPNVQGLGGPASFRARLSKGLAARGIPVYARVSDGPLSAVLVIAGTRRLDQILAARRQGARVVHRLDNINWVHKRRRTGLKHYLRSEYGNWIIATIRRFLADRLVYQSLFAHDWWHTVYGSPRKPWTTIYNGVDLQEYTPEGPHSRPTDHLRVLVVEGNMGDGNELGVINAVQFARALQAGSGQKVELEIAGNAPPAARAAVQAQAGDLGLNWAGVLPRAEIPFHDRSAHLLFSAELNAACPNAVVEALACGLPVVAYATGSLPELVGEDAGAIAPYGADYWKLEPGDPQPLANAALQILADSDRYRAGARARAVELFDIQRVVERYLDVLVG
jgi:glycosyltransferase involved in cell wall biosynthesis